MTLADFLLDLATNTRSLAAYAESPRAFIEGSDLDGPQKEMLLTGDLRKLRIKVEAEIVVGGEKMTIHVICMPVICVPDPGDPDTPNPER
jgi:hypothetical protein